jgi:hypothetical protein
MLSVFEDKKSELSTPYSQHKKWHMGCRKNKIYEVNGKAEKVRFPIQGFSKERETDEG